MTKSEIRDEVRRKLNEVGVQTWWEDSEVDDAVGQGEDELADACEWYERYQTMYILEDRPYYDLRTAIRYDFLCAGPSFNETTNRWLLPFNYRDNDTGDRRWEYRTAEPEYVMMRGLWWVKYWPHKGSEQGTIKQYYKALPRHMSAETDEPGFHRYFHYGLVEYAVADLLSQDNETDLALEAWGRYREFEDAMAAYYDGRAKVPTIHGNSIEGGFM